MPRREREREGIHSTMQHNTLHAGEGSDSKWSNASQWHGTTESVHTSTLGQIGILGNVGIDWAEEKGEELEGDLAGPIEMETALIVAGIVGVALVALKVL